MKHNCCNLRPLFQRYKVQDICANKRNKKSGRYQSGREDYLLTGKLRCGHCGSYMIGLSGTSVTGNCIITIPATDTGQSMAEPRLCDVAAGQYPRLRTDDGIRAVSINYLNLTRSPLVEHYAEASMKTTLECLRCSLADKNDADARGTLLLNSTLSLSGINDLGREGEFAPYPLQSFAQRYLGLDYPRALTGLFPYWLKEICRASADKEIFCRYFSVILGVSADGKDDEALLQEALAALKVLYQEFGIAFTYGELAADPHDHAKLTGIIESFGPMPCHIMELTTERMAKMIEDAVSGCLD